MKWLVLHIALLSIVSAGFFNEEAKSEKAKMLENKRLCKLFTQKAETYKKTMRHDILAKTTLASYEERAQMFCGKAKKIEKELEKE